MQFYFSSKSVNIHPKKSDTIPRFYSNWAILFFEKLINLSPEKKIVSLFDNKSPKNKPCLIVTLPVISF
jgi:hypothetical protein